MTRSRESTQGGAGAQHRVAEGGRYEIHLDAVEQTQRVPRVEDPARPFQVALFGDFSQLDGAGPLRPLRVDRDDLNDVLRRLDPKVSMAWPDVRTPVTLSFDSIWDFEPAELMERMPLFRELKTRVDRSPRTAAAGSPPSPPPGPGLLEDVLSATGAEEAPPPVSGRGNDLQDLIDQALAPHLVKDEPGQAERRAIFEASAQDLLRRLIRDPDFRALESLWRGVDLLCRRVETGPHLKVHVIDVSKERLTREVSAGGSDSPLGRLLLDREGPGAGFSLLVGCYAFQGSHDDLQTLSALGELGRMANAPWVVEAAPDLAELALAASMSDPAPESAWRHLRASGGARFLSLVLPRFLLRLPYGPESGSEPSFFHETEGEAAHGDFVWGSPAILAGLVLAQGFVDRGWSLRPAAPADVGGLPFHVTTEDGETRAQPCAEVVITEGEARRMIEAGLTPVVAFKDQDRVKLLGVHPIADTPFPLAGPWLDG